MLVMYKQMVMQVKEKMVGTTDNNTNNENDAGYTEKNEENQNKGLWDFIKNPKTGDVIIAYVFIFILALIALLITKKKSDKEAKK